MNAQDFWRLYREVYQRRWLAAAVFCGCMAVVVLGAVFMPRYYRAAAYVMPSEAALSKPVIPGAGFASSDRDFPVDPRTKQEKLETLVGLATTAAVRQQAINSLGLDIMPTRLERLVEVEPAAGSIIRITALDRTEEGAIRLANALAHEFAGYYRNLSNQQATRNRQFLESELQEAEADRAKAKAELQAFKSGAREAALPTGTAENPFLAQFYALRSQMDEVRSELRAVEGRLRSARAELAQQPAQREVETGTTDNPLAAQLERDAARLNQELELARLRYTEKHKAVRDLKGQLDSTLARLETERSRVITHRRIEPNPVHQRLKEQIVELGTERAALNARLSSLSGAMGENERRAGQLADTSVLLLSKTRDYDNVQARYDRLSTMLHEARVEEKVSSTQGEIQVVDEAKSAVGPIMRRGPSPGQLLLLGLIVSLGLGLGTALALAYLDDRLQSREDLSAHLGLPVPAVVPELTADVGDVPLARVTELKPLSAHAESYRFLRTELMHYEGRGSLRTLMIATAKPGQGGSTTAVNLATALAEVGNRVVLVDADLRRPGLHLFFGENNDSGLTSLLTNGSVDAMSALRRTALDGLVLLPAGPPVRNPAGLLGSPRMRELLDQLRERADYVVIDTPSAAAFADAAMLGPLVDGVIVVTRAKQSLREVEVRTKDLFAKVGANIVGAVLNDAKAETVDSYYFHHHYYPVTDGESGDGERASGAAALADTSSAEAVAGGLEGNRGAASAGSGSETGEPEVAQTRSEPAEQRRTAHRAQTRRNWPAVLVILLIAVLVGVGAYALLPGYLGKTAAPEAAEASAAADSGAAVTVEAVVRQPAEVRVERDGQLLYEGQLPVGPQTWRGSREITIWTSNPEAIEVTVNGNSIGPLGESGNLPVSRRFTPEEGDAQ